MITKTKKIILVEDEVNLHKDIKKGLKLRGGYEVISAYDGKQAMNLFRKEDPDLILMDIIVPIKDGLELLDYIKNNEKLKDKPVAIVTNLDDTGKMYKSIVMGADAYLLRSDYSIDELIETIELMI